MTKQLCFILELQHFFTLFLFLVTLSQESETKQVFPKVLGSRRSYVKVNLLKQKCRHPKNIIYLNK